MIYLHYTLEWRTNVTMYKPICVASLIFFSVIIKVNSLQCYQCEGCTKVTDDDLVTCGATTTVAPTTTPSGQTTTPNGQTTTPSGQTTTPSGDTTTISGQTTTPSGQTTTPSGETTPNELPSTTPAESTNPSTANTTTASQSTSTATITTASPSDSDVDEGRNFDVSRVKRDAVLVQERAAEYVCLVVKYNLDNGTEVVARGCGMDEDGKICDEIKGAINATYCSTCKTDKCNGAVSIQVSLILVFTAILFGTA